MLVARRSRFHGVCWRGVLRGLLSVAPAPGAWIAHNADVS